MEEGLETGSEEEGSFHDPGELLFQLIKKYASDFVSQTDDPAESNTSESSDGSRWSDEEGVSVRQEDSPRRGPWNDFSADDRIPPRNPFTTQNAVGFPSGRRQKTRKEGHPKMNTPKPVETSDWEKERKRKVTSAPLVKPETSSYKEKLTIKFSGSGVDQVWDRPLCSDGRKASLGRERSPFRGMWDGFNVEDYAPLRKPTHRKNPKDGSPKFTTLGPFQKTTQKETKVTSARADKSPIRAWEEDSLEELLDAKCRSSKGPPSPQEKARLDDLWCKFCVDHWLLHTPFSETKPKKWSPQITVPKPFQMTLRDEERKATLAFTDKAKTILGEQRKTKIQANPVPMSTYVPEYKKMVEQNEQHRKIMKEIRKAQLLLMQAPFSFIEREVQRREEEPDDGAMEAPTKLAHSVPASVLDPMVSVRLKERETCRKIQAQQRAEEMLRKACAPKSMLDARQRDKASNTVPCEAEQEHRPKPAREVPDFEALHREFQEKLQKKKPKGQVTVCQAFQFHRTKREEQIKRYEQLKRFGNQMVNGWCWEAPQPQAEEDFSTIASKLAGVQSEIIRKFLEEQRWKKEGDQERKRRNKHRSKVHRQVTERLRLYNTNPNLEQILQAKLEQYRRQERLREAEYAAELQEMQERVDNKPLLFERVMQNNARMAMERQFSRVLQELGLDELLIRRQASDRDDEKVLLEDEEDASDAKEEPKVVELEIEVN
ncbi:protein FAM161A-like isoform X1 [Latimeria chalumnae]|uniref:protein FAM161A-like isoform X1 n=1 Tax=Latimeria chalumnae TaxID=7897 RepID=UPI00313B5C98